MHVMDLHVPPCHPSSDASSEQLALARQQGDAVSRAVDAMIQSSVSGDKKRAGDYIVGYAIGKAEGMYQMIEGELEWQEPVDENCLVEIVVQDGADFRFVPALDVTCTLTDPAGHEIGMNRQPFLWHPWIYRYGRNWRVPFDGNYTLKVHIDPPAFPRHDELNGNRYANPVNVLFHDVRIVRGRKR